MITVINIRKAPAGWQQDPRYIYIGRAGHGQDGYFGNPFPLYNEAARERVLVDYSNYFERRVRTDEQFRTRIAKMPTDAILVCFCAPKLCHGDKIAAYANFVHADDYVPFEALA